jgi:hypothetical protein
MVVLLLLHAADTAAQSCTTATTPADLNATCAVNTTASITLRRVVRLAATPATAVLPTPTVSEFEQGFQQVLAHLVEVRANAGWQLRVSTTATVFTAAGGARPNKPAADLLWAPDPLPASFQPLSTTPGLLASGTATAATTITLHYRMLWSWALDSPGTYSIPVRLTVSSP